MSLRHTAFTALFLFGLAHGAAAQDGTVQPTNAQPAEGQPSATQGAEVDVDRLPIDVRRIQRGLAQSTREREERDGGRLRYIIDVFGQAPPIELFTREDNLLYGPVPYGAPTHKEMIYMVTPQEFRSPVMDFSAIARWLADRSKKK